jgi:2-oxoglutarate ferredoxin oxidoreductase subunit delta
MAKGKIEIDKDRCKGCAICITGCKHGVIEMSEHGKTNVQGYRYLVNVHPENCIGCGFCGFICPDSVITVYRESK